MWQLVSTPHPTLPQTMWSKYGVEKWINSIVHYTIKYYIRTFKTAITKYLAYSSISEKTNCIYVVVFLLKCSRQICIHIEFTFHSTYYSELLWSYTMIHYPNHDFILGKIPLNKMCMKSDSKWPNPFSNTNIWFKQAYNQSVGSIFTMHSCWIFKYINDCVKFDKHILPSHLKVCHINIHIHRTKRISV